MAMSIIWMGMVAAAMIYAALHGTGAALSGAVAAGAKQAVELSLTMAGSLCLWSGFAPISWVWGTLRPRWALPPSAGCRPCPEAVPPPTRPAA